MELKIEYVPLEELKPYENNTKIHTPKQIEEIKESIRLFGFDDPIAVWHENEIIEGHGRLIAAKQMGIEKVPIIRLDHLTDEERRAYIILHNKLTMDTGFDVKKLNEELEKIKTINMADFDLKQVFDEIEAMEKKAEKPELKFTEVLGEEHNYIVLYFDTLVDWLQLQSLIDVSGKMNLSTSKDGTIKENMKRVSVGRVFRGKDVLEKLREHYENKH